MSILREPPGEPSRRTYGLTDSRGNFTFSVDEANKSNSQTCTVHLDVDTYFTSLGTIAGYKQVALLVRTINTEREYRIMTAITPFAHTTWYLW